MEPSPNGLGKGGQVLQTSMTVTARIAEIPHSTPSIPIPMAMPMAMAMHPSVIVTSANPPPSQPPLTRRRRSASSEDSDGEEGYGRSPEKKKMKKIISPFDPEAIVPLPHQLDEMGSTGTTVWKRNERERYRVRCVNEGYERLRAQLPYGTERRLSKVDTLRLAVDYIKHMGYLLDNPLHDNECQCFVKTLTNTNYGSSGE